jgi:hypothetical protein
MNTTDISKFSVVVTLILAAAFGAPSLAQTAASQANTNPGPAFSTLEAAQNLANAQKGLARCQGGAFPSLPQ